MTKIELLTAIETENLIPRSKHEKRVEELAKELHTQIFTKCELQKMKKETLKRIAWILNLWGCEVYDKSMAIEYVSKHLIDKLSNVEMFI